MGNETLIYVGQRDFGVGEHGVPKDARDLDSVIARSKARILLLPKREFDGIVDQEPRCFRHFAKLALARTAVFLQAFVQASSLAPETRLRGQLALLTQMKIEEQSLQGAVDLSLSQTDLAAIVGVSRQTINPMLRKLADQGSIELGFRRIRVFDPRGLSVGDRPLAAALQRSLHRTEVATPAAVGLEDPVA